MSAGEATSTVHPAVLVNADHAEGTLGVVTAGEGEHEALVVFRGPDDARAYQRDNCKHSAAEGFEIIGMGRDALASLLDKQGISWVAMPEEWTGSGSVDLFSAAGFLELLDTAEPVG